jgi:hypothetical protein
MDGAIHCGSSARVSGGLHPVPHPERSELFLDISELISE